MITIPVDLQLYGRECVMTGGNVRQRYCATVDRKKAEYAAYLTSLNDLIFEICWTNRSEAKQTAENRRKLTMTDERKESDAGTEEKSG